MDGTLGQVITGIENNNTENHRGFINVTPNPFNENITFNFNQELKGLGVTFMKPL